MKNKAIFHEDFEKKRLIANVEYTKEFQKPKFSIVFTVKNMKKMLTKI